jgi:uncharacterized protein
VAVGRGLAGLLEAYLTDRRLETAPGDRDADLTCFVPEGGSVLKLHGDLATAVGYWGGTIASGEEKILLGEQRALDLRITRNHEAVRLRLLQDWPAAGDGRIALVIDDFGYQDPELIARFLDLPIPFTPAILPGYARSTHVARLAQEKGRAAILHLPMEPKDYPAEDPGPGAIFTRMDHARIRQEVENDLRDLAGIVGASNHMGSRASDDTAVVGTVLEVLGERGLFFLDSGTSTRSAFPATAARRGVACLAADLFLDGEPNPTRATMARHLAEARDLAFRDGSAIVIGHARPATLDFLLTAPDSLRAWGCRAVPLTDLLR